MRLFFFDERPKAMRKKETKTARGLDRGPQVHRTNAPKKDVSLFLMTHCPN